MKTPIKQARAIANLELDLKIISTQQALWRLRAQKKEIRKREVERQLKEIKTP